MGVLQKHDDQMGTNSWGGSNSVKAVLTSQRYLLFNIYSALEEDYNPNLISTKETPPYLMNVR